MYKMHPFANKEEVAETALAPVESDLAVPVAAVPSDEIPDGG